MRVGRFGSIWPRKSGETRQYPVHRNIYYIHDCLPGICKPETQLVSSNFLVCLLAAVGVSNNRKCSLSTLDSFFVVERRESERAVGSNMYFKELPQTCWGLLI